MQLCSKPRVARGIEPETFGRRGQLLSRPPTTGPKCDSRVCQPELQRLPCCREHSIRSVNVNNLLAISELDPRQLRSTGTTSRGGKPPGNPPQPTACNSQGLLLCSARWSRAVVFETQGGSSGFEPETFGRRGQLLSCPLTKCDGIVDLQCRIQSSRHPFALSISSSTGLLTLI